MRHICSSLLVLLTLCCIIESSHRPKMVPGFIFIPPPRSYNESPKPETAVIVSLSQQLGLDPYIVRVWFTNRWYNIDIILSLASAYNRRQKDKRIASGGSVSAGAAYRNPSTEATGTPTPAPHPPSSSSSDGQPATEKTSPTKVLNRSSLST